MNLVIDRTSDDVENGTVKGSYGSADLNRVNEAVKILHDKLTAAGYNPSVEVKTDWKDGGWMNQQEAKTYLENLRSLAAQLVLPETAPAVPERIFAGGGQPGLDYQQANDIEALLLTIDDFLSKSQKAAFYSGEIYSGEVNA